MAQVKPFRTFDVTVSGYGSGQFIAQSRGKALADAWRSSAFDGWSFREFLKRATAKLSAPQKDHYESLRESYPMGCIPKAGTRVTAEGHTGIVLPAIEPCSYVSFQDEVTGERVNVHPIGVRLAPGPQAKAEDTERERSGATTTTRGTGQ